MSELTPKLQKKEAQEKELAEKRAKLQASYKAIQDTPAFKDLLRFLSDMSNALTYSAKNRVGNMTGSFVPITNEQALQLLDKSNGYDEIKAYVSSFLKEEATDSTPVPEDKE